MRRENFCPFLISYGQHNFDWDAVGDEGKGKIIDVLTGRAISLFAARAEIMPGTRSSTAA